MLVPIRVSYFIWLTELAFSVKGIKCPGMGGIVVFLARIVKQLFQRRFRVPSVGCTRATIESISARCPDYYLIPLSTVAPTSAHLFSAPFHWRLDWQPSYGY
jgi:hypothetical protein